MDYHVHIRTLDYEEDENGEKTIIETEHDEVVPNPEEVAAFKKKWFEEHPEDHELFPEDQKQAR